MGLLSRLIPQRGSRVYQYLAANWNLDIAIRYRAVASILAKSAPPDASLLELGAGAISIARFFECNATAVDTAFPVSRNDRCRRLKGSACALPFADQSWDVVVSVDMLEHIPPPNRPRALREMVRVARHLVVLAVPVGQASYQHDGELHKYHIRQHGLPHRFGAEHIEFGLSERDDIIRDLELAAVRGGREISLSRYPNNSLRLRSRYMKLAFHRWYSVRFMYVAMYPVAYVAHFFDRKSECYRDIFVARLQSTKSLPSVAQSVFPEHAEQY